MKQCPYCGHENLDTATVCHKCDASFAYQRAETAHKDYWMGPEKARAIRSKALVAIVVGLLITVYWGGYGPWPVIDHPTWASIRPWLAPLLLIGGALLYIAGWVLKGI